MYSQRPDSSVSNPLFAIGLTMKEGARKERENGVREGKNERKGCSHKGTERYLRTCVNLMKNRGLPFLFTYASATAWVFHKCDSQ